MMIKRKGAWGIWKEKLDVYIFSISYKHNWGARATTPKKTPGFISSTWSAISICLQRSLSKTLGSAPWHGIRQNLTYLQTTPQKKAGWCCFWTRNKCMKKSPRDGQKVNYTRPLCQGPGIVKAFFLKRLASVGHRLLAGCQLWQSGAWISQIGMPSLKENRPKLPRQEEAGSSSKDINSQGAKLALSFRVQVFGSKFVPLSGR